MYSIENRQTGNFSEQIEMSQLRLHKSVVVKSFWFVLHSTQRSSKGAVRQSRPTGDNSMYRWCLETIKLLLYKDLKAFQRSQHDKVGQTGSDIEAVLCRFWRKSRLLHLNTGESIVINDRYGSFWFMCQFPALYNLPSSIRSVYHGGYRLMNKRRKSMVFGKSIFVQIKYE